MHNWKEIYRTCRRQPAGRLGIGLLIALLLIAVMGPAVAPFAPGDVGGPPLLPPHWPYLLGTNALGQDIFSQLMHGCRTSLVAGALTGAGAVTVGLVTGALAGYYPWPFGFIFMRVVDVLLTVPRLPFIILIAAWGGNSLITIILLLIFFGWPGVARTVRSYVLAWRELDYVRFVRFCGGSFFYLLRRHLLPELLPLLVARMVSLASNAIAAEAGLSFLGLGDPTVCSWGKMVRGAFDYPGLLWTDAWLWWLLPPGLMIGLAIMAFTLSGFALEESLRHASRGEGQLFAGAEEELAFTPGRTYADSGYGGRAG